MGDEYCTPANDFAEEEAACCASLALEVDERDGASYQDTDLTG